jgi:hypothetical protein
MFFLLAYCTMLVHSVVPHHHHDSEMYLVTGVFRDVECCEKHAPFSGHSTEDEHQHEDKCGLQLPAVLRANEDVVGSFKSVIKDLPNYSIHIIVASETIDYHESLSSSLDNSIQLLHSGISPGAYSLRRGPPAV